MLPHRMPRRPSGAPLFDERGHVVGLHCGESRSGVGQGCIEGAQGHHLISHRSARALARHNSKGRNFVRFRASPPSSRPPPPTSISHALTHAPDDHAPRTLALAAWDDRSGIRHGQKHAHIAAALAKASAPVASGSGSGSAQRKRPRGEGASGAKGKGKKNKRKG